jgi:hypothetical protein
MNGRFTYVCSSDVLDVFAGGNRSQREELLRIFQTIAANPYQRGDYVEKDATGRNFQVKRFGRWLIVFWLDDPVREVRIIEIKRVVG